MGVSGAFLYCEAAPEIVRARLAARRNDASDADWNIYLKAAENWQKPSAQTEQNSWAIPSGGTPDQAFSRALEVLRELQLFG
jgi:predicted kinase